MVYFIPAIPLLFLANTAFVSAMPAAAAAPMPTAAPRFDNAALEKRTACTFTDAAAVSKSKALCATIVLSNIAVPSGTTLNLENLQSGTQVIFQGTTTFGYELWSGPLISVSGANIAVSGAVGHSIDCDGARWWDTYGANKPSNGKAFKVKPKFFAAHSITGTSSISGLKVKNTPLQGFSINSCSGSLTMDGIHIDNSAGDAGNLAHNTDAFDVGSSSGVKITNPVIHNQDDCLAVNSGTNIIFSGASCTGGHGISIGSIGGRTDNIVDTVTVSSSTIINSDNGVRIKTISGATGKVNNVSYQDITLQNIAKYGVVIEQDYLNGGPTGIPTGGVPITGLTLNNVHGTVASSGTNIYILCAAGACSKWSWTGVNVTGGKASGSCKAIPTPGGAHC